VTCPPAIIQDDRAAKTRPPQGPITTAFLREASWRQIAPRIGRPSLRGRQGPPKRGPPAGSAARLLGLRCCEVAMRHAIGVGRAQLQSSTPLSYNAGSRDAASRAPRVRVRVTAAPAGSRPRRLRDERPS
jgi:hypothetical protein